MFTVPVDFVGEFRGNKQAAEMVIRGEKILAGEVLFFEIENPLSGEPMLVKVRCKQLDRDGVGYEGMQKGDDVRIVGVVRASEQGDEYGSQLVISLLEPATPSKASRNGTTAAAVAA